MINFLRKYWLNILLTSLLFLLLFYIIPSLEKHYTELDTKHIKEISENIALWSAGILTALYILYFLLKHKFELLSLFRVIFLSAFFGFWLYIIFKEIILGSALFINTAFKGNVLHQKYQVAAFPGQNGNDYFLFNTSNGEKIQSKKITEQLNTIKPSIQDTVVIAFDKGILGYKLNPRFKEHIKPAALK